MGGIGNELALSELGALQCGQDCVEAHCESAELVAAFNWDPRSEVSGCGEALGCSCQTSYRSQNKSRNSGPEEQREDHAGGCCKRECHGQPRELSVLRRLDELERKPFTESGHQFAYGHGTDSRAREIAVGLAGRDRAHSSRSREAEPSRARE